MNNKLPETPPPAAFGLDDLSYLFFRHKWKIIFFTLVGIGIAVTLYLTDKTAYRSQAKLLVRYITEKRDIRETGAKDEKDISRPLDPRESSIMTAEAEILRSTDGILSAIRSVTAEKVLSAYGGGTNELDALDLVLKNFQVDLGKNSGVMVLTLTHRDQDLAQSLLREIIREYKVNHLEIHHSGASYAEVSRQTEAIKTALNSTELELRRQKKEVNVSNLEQSKLEFATQISELKKDIFKSEADLAALRAQVEERKGTSGNQTNQVAQGETKGEKDAPTPAQIAKFNQLSRRLTGLRAYELELLQTFSESSTRVKQLRQEITDLEDQLSKLPIDPAMLMQAANNNPGAAPQTPIFDFQAARARIAALEAQYQTLTNRLQNVREEAAKVDGAEASIVQLERQRKLQEDEYAYYVRSLEELKLERTIDINSRNNIRVIQDPTRIPPDAKKLAKQAGAACGGGVAFGFLLALLLDFVIHPNVKRSKELESSIKLPVLASIPDFGNKLKLSRKQKKTAALQKNGVSHANGEIAPWEEADPMLPYYEALRDRIVMSYNGDLHKPKIVGLTSCHHGAGVSRLATGLAASLSRDLPRNILLVALQKNKVAVSSFAKGRPIDGLESAPEETHPEHALVVQNLNSLATTGRNLAGASVVQSFSDLLPKLKISDYDYVIFDLPPLSQTTGSLRLASQMERTVLVVEAEETSKEKVKRAKSLLKSSHTNLLTVLNKTRSYGPKSLRDDA